MKVALLTAAIAMGLVGVGEAQIAEGERIVEILTCTVNEGSTILPFFFSLPTDRVTTPTIP